MSDLVRTLVADPPWRFADGLPGGGRGAEKHYRTLSVPDIQRFPLPDLAKDARLFLWRPASFQLEALKVIEAWGFAPKAEIVWVKLKNDYDRRLARACRRWLEDGEEWDWSLPDDLIRIGMGRQVRNAHETCVVATRGRPERLSASVPSVIFAPRGAHSEKPVEFYRLVERLSPGPIVELFARCARPGWTCYGDELPGGSPAPQPKHGGGVEERPSSDVGQDR